MLDPRPTIDPGMAPDGLVIRIWRNRKVICFEPIPDMDEVSDEAMHAIVDRHTDITVDDATTPTWVEIFDGDDGTRMAAFAVIPVTGDDE